MKILLIWPYFYPEHGAAAVRGNAFARYLKQENIQIEVIAPIKKDLRVKKKYNYKENDVDIPVYRLPLIFDTKDVFVLLQSFLKLETLIKKINPNLILSSSTPSTVTWQSALLSKKLKIPFIMDVRDPYASSLRSTSNKPLIHKLASYVETQSLKQATLVFPVTPHLKNLLIKEYQISENKIKIVPNGFDFQNINVSKNNKENDIVFIGSLTNLGRNTDNILNILKNIKLNLPNISIKIVGCKNKENIEKLFIENQLQKNVILKEPIDHLKIPNELAYSKIGLIVINQNSNFEYQIPTKTYEYLAVGLTICALGPSNGALKKFIEKNQIGFYSDKQSELINKMIDLIENKKLWEKMHSNALKTSKAYHRKNIVKNALNNYIRPLLE